MISIIVCSRTPNLEVEYKRNIEGSIGTEFEWVIIDNSHNTYSIFAAYNEGVRRSRGSILAFLHDDILFHSSNWGRDILQLFGENIGIIGILGGHVITDQCKSWMSTLHRCGDIIQTIRNKQGDIIQSYQSNSPNIYPFDNHLLDVSVVDGLCFFAQRKLFETISFDEITYGHCFHAYDIDISMQCQDSGYRVCVTDLLQVEHFSHGNMNESWQLSMNQFTVKWKDNLPLVRVPSGENSEYVLKADLLYEELCNEKGVLVHKLAKIRQSIPYKLVSMLYSIFRKK